MTSQLKLLSPPRFCSKRTLNTTSSISYEFIQPNNKSQVSVCSPAFSCSCVKDILRKQVLTLTLNQPRKVISSFQIREVGILFHLTFYYCLETTSSRGKSGSAAPAPQSQWCPIYVFVLTPF